ncbi:YetF domain-containing protein [Sabulicella rubraurantiaca]|uniref:YetF domain-containing protein n=1 Tax=Sabulicella rubraurantiaca TaxID=2811429 RepID=UPI001A972C26|nr:YetF domain-containing protein [Sabulicella rubraurantiaca]
MSAQPLPIVRNGKLLRRNMRQEFLTEEELMAHLRMEGIDGIEEVKSAHVESDGKVTVVRRETSKS